MKIAQRVATLAAAGTLLGGSLVGLSATTAEAVTAGHCDWTSVVRNNSGGHGYFKGRTPVRTMPYKDCASKSYASGRKFFYWCYLRNEHNNKWIFGRVAGTQHTGWVYAGNIKNSSGTLRKC
ncbi:hypothetical protein [Streptomyces sp. NPDC059788]|uniref:hypothetical protein n=1 Tax=Streptomyces sp. NPDC059788 TaxID=3346948 RepID=UPI00364AE2E9